MPPLSATATSICLMPVAAIAASLPENTGDKPFELVLVELKRKPATAK
jgi:hypothetical protein